MKTVRVQLSLGDESVLKDLPFNPVPQIGDEIRLRNNQIALVSSRAFTISGEIFLFADFYGEGEESKEMTKHLLANGWASNTANLRFT